MKRYLALLLALCMLFALAACGGKTADPKPASTPEAAGQAAPPAEDKLDTEANKEELQKEENKAETYIRDKVTFIDKDTTSLSPWGTRNSVPGVYEVYEMLYCADSKGVVYAQLADASAGGNMDEFPGCTHEPGSGVYEVKIYDYITDHKGNAVTAEDVAFSFMYQYENDSTSGWGDLVSVEAADPTTVVFTFKQDQVALGQLFNIFCRCFIVDEESFNASESQLANEMIGTGPYMFDSYDSGARVTIVRNESYWQKPELIRQEQQANVNTIVYEFITESAQKTIALQTGAADMVSDLSYESALEFSDGGAYEADYNVFTYLQKFVHYLDCNCSTDSPCNDINLRLAIYNAIDVDGLITAMGGTMVKLPGYVSGFYTDYDFVDWGAMENYNTKTGVDAAKVQELLDASSYDGEKLTLITQGEGDVASIIAAQLEAFGIHAEVKDLDRSSANAAVADSTAWDMSLGMMAGDYNVTVWQHGFSFHNTDGTHSANFVTDKAWDDLLNLCCTEEGHTSENMKLWWQTAVDNAYTMGLFTGNSYNIVPADMTYVCMGDKNTFLPGGCTYAEPTA